MLDSSKPIQESDDSVKIIKGNSDLFAEYAHFLIGKCYPSLQKGCTYFKKQL